MIWTHLQEKHAFKFLLTRRLNTDPLENFFGSIRQQGGNSDSPTPIQFTRTFSNLLIFFKAYESNKSFGGLLNPTAHFLQYVEVLEDTFIANFSIYTKSDGIGKSILSKLEQVSAPFHCCEKFPKVFMQKLFLRIRIYYALKFAN